MQGLFQKAAIIYPLLEYIYWIHEAEQLVISVQWLQEAWVKTHIKHTLVEIYGAHNADQTSGTIVTYNYFVML